MTNKDIITGYCYLLDRPGRTYLLGDCERFTTHFPGSLQLLSVLAMSAVSGCFVFVVLVALNKKLERMELLPSSYAYLISN